MFAAAMSIVASSGRTSASRAVCTAWSRCYCTARRRRRVIVGVLVRSGGQIVGVFVGVPVSVGVDVGAAIHRARRAGERRRGVFVNVGITLGVGGPGS
jgi:hypothetical protein